ncbi:ATP-binding protein [Planktothricoides raciborskii]|nr:ATP-binding protein [Planktothricoides raciborskii]
MAFMDVTEILQFVDGLVYQHTGKHLDDVQRAVVKGSYEGDTYNEIGEKNRFNKSHVGEVGGDLWKLLSEALGEDIKKTNCRSVLERVYIQTFDNCLNVCNINGDRNVCNPVILNYPNKPTQENEIDTKYQSAYRDLTLAPKVIKFSNREPELQTLYNWIFNQNTPLISVLGLSGLGKTALVRRFIDLNLDGFEVIIWKNLELNPSLNQIITEILTTVETPEISKNSPVSQLLNLLKEKRCLIIIDDVQHIFTPGQFAGQYQAESKDYQKFFTAIAETEHQSNIILISEEKCADMQCLDDRLYPVKALELLGLDDINILDNTGLNNQDSWLKLIQLYQGNPSYLKDIARLIQDVYDGNAADFLAENSLVITQNMQADFNDLFNRVSPIEQQIILDFSKFDRPMSREELKENLALSSVDFVKGLQSLQYRYIVTKIKSDKILFKLSPVFSEYVRNYCQD